MMMTLRAALLPLCLLCSPAIAQSPVVLTDIPPVQSLVAMVMDQMPLPGVLAASDAAAHDLALRPSQAAALSAADLVVWIGPALTPTLPVQLQTLASGAKQLALMPSEGTHRLPYRQDAVFDHDDHDGDHDDGHDEGDEDDHDHGHDHGADGAAEDPHLWLDPDNAILWLPLIAEQLGQIDPANQAQYQRNAEAAIDTIKAAQTGAAQTLEPIKDKPLAAYHDAFQYYEQAFDLTMVGAISDSDAVQPGPRRLSALQEAFSATQPVCFLMEPGGNARMLDSVGGAPNLALLDPLGAHLEPGPGLYPALLQDMARRIAECAR